MSWIVLILSGVLEAVWATALGRSEGLSRLWPSVVFVGALLASMAGLAFAMREIPTGTAYAVWVGVNVFPPFFTHLVMSMGRFTAVLFPLFFLMATALPASRRWRVASCFAAAQAILATLFFLWRPIV